MNGKQRPLAVVTGGSHGIGFELAKQCLENGFDVIIAADHDVKEAVSALNGLGGGAVSGVQADLAKRDGIDKLYATLGERTIDALLVNAGDGLGAAFLEQSFDDIDHFIEMSITGSLCVIHRVAKDMRERHAGRVLIAGSIADGARGGYPEVYNGAKAFLDAFTWALRNALQDTGVTVTCLIPDANEKIDPTQLARTSFKAMLAGEGDGVTGMKSVGAEEYVASI
jgi:short-subunit dehydrogenase